MKSDKAAFAIKVRQRDGYADVCTPNTGTELYFNSCRAWKNDGKIRGRKTLEKLARAILAELKRTAPKRRKRP